jgi:Lipopolysaccharide kinase (Kdo/WaaP) family
MAAALDAYRRRRNGEWVTWVNENEWREAWWPILARAFVSPGAPLATSRHARSTMLSLPGAAGDRDAYLKVYRSAGWPTRLKDVVRPSKARRALRMSAALAADGFAVAPVLAAGESRRLRCLRAAFLLTAAVPGRTLTELARELAALPARERRARRRSLLGVLGAEVGRLHEAGYVHGDLVATNILATERPPRVCFIDHDRTRRAAVVDRRHQERRNLIQLNRLPLAGVTHADRLRVFLSYARARHWPRERRRREARRLAAATRRRRLEIEAIRRRKAVRAAAT